MSSSGSAPDPAHGSLSGSVAWEPLMRQADDFRHGTVALDECAVQKYDLEPGHVVPLEAHAFSEQLIQVLDGCLNLSLDGVPHELTAENLLVIPTAVHHHGGSERATSMVAITAPVGFGPDNMRLDLTESRGEPLAPVGSSVVSWSEAAGHRLTGAFLSLCCVGDRHHGRGGPVVIQVVRGHAQVTVGDETAVVDSSVVTLVPAGDPYEVAVLDDGAVLVVDVTRSGQAPKPPAR